MKKCIKAALLVDGNGGETIKNAVVIVDGNIISQVGTAGEVDESGCEEIIDCGAGTLLPGLIDGHSHCGEDSCREESVLQQHLAPPALKALRAYVSLKKDLLSGVTTIRLLGDGEGCVDKQIRDAINCGEIDGPRVLAACMAIRPGQGTAPEIGVVADGVDEVRKAVRKAIFLGADVIKLFISNISQGGTYLDYLKGDLTTVAAYTKEEIEVAVSEAHRAGVKVACHCIGGDAVKWALESGVDSLEHCNLISEDDIQYFLKYDGIISDPNLHLFFDPVKGFESSANKTHKWNELPVWWHEKVRFSRENSRRVFSKALKEGVKFSLGTDLNHGFLWLECKYFVSEIGATEMEAILAVTKNGAISCGIDDRLGTIEPGKLADIICTQKNPLSDIENLKNITFVMKDGVAIIKP